MRNFYRWIFLIMIFFGISSSHANEKNVCSKDMRDIVGNYLKIKNFAPRNEDDAGTVIAEACKVWPDNKNIILMAFAYGADAATHKNIEYRKNVIVVMADQIKERIVSSHQFVIEEDATTEISSDSFEIDTARYQLSKNVRAFGLRFQSSARGASCGEAHWNNELTLFVPEGRKLRPVFSLYMDQQKSVRSCLGVPTESSVWLNSELSISVSNTQSNGYADLLVQANIWRDDVSTANDEKRKVRHSKGLLRYDGNYYLAAQNKPWWFDTSSYRDAVIHTPRR